MTRFLLFLPIFISLFSAGIATVFNEKEFKLTDAASEPDQLPGDKLLDDLAAAIQRGDKSFKIIQGTYRISKSIRITGVKDFVLDGQSSILIFDVDSALKGGFIVSNCSNLTIRNLTTDWGKMPFTQGTILNIDSLDGTVSYKPQDGYDEMYSDLRKSTNIWRMFVFDTNRVITPYQVRMSVNVSGPGNNIFDSKDLNGCYRFIISSPNNPGYKYTATQKGVYPGAKVALCCRMGADLFTFINCGLVTIENVVSYTSPKTVIIARGGAGPLIFRKFKNIPRHNSGQLLSSGCDGFNIANMKNGPILDSCTLEGISDDFLNVYGTLQPVFAQINSKELLVGLFPLNGDSVPVLHFLTGGTYKYLADIKVKSVSGLEDYTLPVNWNKGNILPDIWKGKGFNPGDKIMVFRIVLEQSITIPPEGTCFSSENAVCTGTIIRNCNFSQGMARGLFLSTRNALVENNTLTRLMESAIVLGSEPSLWASAIAPRNIIIRNNSITLTNFRSISSTCSGAIQIGLEIDPNATGEWIDGLTISNNNFFQPGGSAISINGAKNITISGNRFEECGNLPWHGFGRQPDKYGIPVAVYYGNSVTQTNNIIVNPGFYSLDQ
jgi:pectate lyase